MGKETGNFDGAETTIFSSRDTMTSAERVAVKSGEKRGERIAMKENPKRFSLAKSAAINKKKYDAGYRLAFGHD